MKRCEVCQKLADGSAKYCQNCGTKFEHVSRFSESRILLTALVIVLLGIIIANSLPLRMPDPSECSETSFTRFKRIVDTYYKETKNILRAEMITSRQLSELMGYKYDAQEIPVPACLEPAKAEFVAYLEDVYYIALYSVWGSFRASAEKVQSAGEHWEALNGHLDEIEECVPNCP